MKINLHIDKVNGELNLGDVLVFNNKDSEDYYMVVRDSSCFEYARKYRLLGLRDGLLHDEHSTLEEILPDLNTVIKNDYILSRIIKSNELEIKQIS